MPSIADEAVCVRHWDFSETSQTVSLFSRSHGLVRGLAKGARRERGAFGGGIDLLTRGHFAAIVKPGRDLSTLTEWGLAQVWWTLRRDLPANRAAFYMAEVIGRLHDLLDPHPGAYDALVGGLDALEDGASADAALLAFQWCVLADAGYEPRLGGVDVEAGTVTSAFSAREGGLVADNGAGDRWRVRGETVLLLREVASAHRNGEDAMTATLQVARGAEATTTSRATRLLAAYVREILGVEPRTAASLWPSPA